MKTLQERITADRMVAMKKGIKEVKVLLGTVIGELNRIDKIVSDEIVLKTIKKLIDANLEIGSEEAYIENEILKDYLPIQLTNDKLETIISDIIEINSYSGMKDMGKVMKILSTGYIGKYDGKSASIIVRTKLG